jgi:hypothetical protein
MAAPIPVQGIIDTGTDVTAVAAHLLGQLGLVPVTGTTTHTASGSVRVDLYEISLSVQGSLPATGLLIVRPSLIVMELKAIPPNVDLLLGRDVLDECLFFYDGPGRQFILAC